ncbi:MAG: transposase domain-containing protein [Burkholderia sp.]
MLGSKNCGRSATGWLEPKASLNLYSLIETCKANNVDVYQYPIDLFKALPLAQMVDDYEALLPWKLGKPARKPKT